ncbi:MAG: hypothetical protein MK193_08355 [Lentisphaeria bacterium]|nr:hypothetical protein [Lentisphaeria bacterium]
MRAEAVQWYHQWLIAGIITTILATVAALTASKRVPETSDYYHHAAYANCACHGTK